MKSAASQAVTRYDTNSRDRALLRYSLWVADNHRCYLCDDPKPLHEIEIDHILPKKLKTSDFNKQWSELAHGMPNRGVHDINNLRAACSRCNSARRKGSIQLSPSLLDVHLAKSERITSAAIEAQRKLRRKGDVGESLVHLTTARTVADHEVLWDDALNQALVATLHDASGDLGTRVRRRDAWTANYLIEVETSDDISRLLAALQLVSGVALDRLLDRFTDTVAREISTQFSALVKSQYNGLRGPDVGPIDWGNSLFSFVVTGVTIAEDDLRCEVSATVDTVFSAAVSVQSEDGSELETTQADGSVRAEFDLEADVSLGGVDVALVPKTVDLKTI